MQGYDFKAITQKISVLTYMTRLKEFIHNITNSFEHLRITFNARYTEATTVHNRRSSWKIFTLTNHSFHYNERITVHIKTNSWNIFKLTNHTAQNRNSWNIFKNNWTITVHQNNLTVAYVTSVINSFMLFFVQLKCFIVCFMGWGLGYLNCLFIQWDILL